MLSHIEKIILTVLLFERSPKGIFEKLINFLCQKKIPNQNDSIINKSPYLELFRIMERQMNLKNSNKNKPIIDFSYFLQTFLDSKFGLQTGPVLFSSECLTECSAKVVSFALKDVLVL